MTVDLSTSTASTESIASREGEAEFPSGGGDILRCFFAAEATGSYGDGARLFTWGSLECNGREEYKSTMKGSSQGGC
jgi:hypothetical protein